jgi:site-specific DNA-methyltransferase (adenine-specific)
MTIAPALFSSSKSDWETPDDLYRALDAEFGFILDVCGHEHNHKHPVYYGHGGVAPDALAETWPKGAKWMNPPYGKKIATWVKKAAESKGVVALLPARTDTKWWHAYIWDVNLNQPRPGVEVRFIPGRLKFKGAKHGAPFPSVLVVWR